MPLTNPQSVTRNWADGTEVNFSWITVADFLGWGSESGLTKTVSGGTLNLVTTGADPFIYSSTGLGINSTNNKYLIIRLTTSNTSDNTHQIYFRRTTDGTFDESRKVEWNVPANSNRYVFILNMGANANWNGTIDQLRYDPGQVTGKTINVFYLSVGNYVVPISGCANDAGAQFTKIAIANINDNRIGLESLKNHTHGGQVTAQPVNTTWKEGLNSRVQSNITKIYAQHVSELRTQLNTLDNHDHVGSATQNPRIEIDWTDPTLTVNMSAVRAYHINELRQSLEELNGHQHFYCSCQCTCQCTCNCDHCGKHNCVFD